MTKSLLGKDKVDKFNWYILLITPSLEKGLYIRPNTVHHKEISLSEEEIKSLYPQSMLLCDFSSDGKNLVKSKCLLNALITWHLKMQNS